MLPDGSIEFDRMDTHRRAVETENEAFFLRITRVGDYFYEAADVGILVMRGRLMTDEGELSDRARGWIDGIRGLYRTTPVEKPVKPGSKAAEIASFKMM
jgi:hypothetical protein